MEGLAYKIKKDDGIICSLIDANNHQVYCGIFDNNYNLVNEYIADDIDNVSTVLEKFSNITFVGDGAYNYLNKTDCISTFLASQIGLFGYEKYLNGIHEYADTITPLYLRVSQAERMRQQNDSNS